MLDTSQAYLSWTNTITVQYLSKTGQKPPGSGVPITNVLWTEISKDGDQVVITRRFRMAKAVMSGIVPKLKDIVIDDHGLRWEVVGVQVLSFGNEYRLKCQKSTKNPQTVPVG